MHPWALHAMSLPAMHSFLPGPSLEGPWTRIWQHAAIFTAACSAGCNHGAPTASAAVFSPVAAGLRNTTPTPDGSNIGSATAPISSSPTATPTSPRRPPITFARRRAKHMAKQLRRCTTTPKCRYTSLAFMVTRCGSNICPTTGRAAWRARWRWRWAQGP